METENIGEIVVDVLNELTGVKSKRPEGIGMTSEKYVIQRLEEVCILIQAEHMNLQAERTSSHEKSEKTYVEINKEFEEAVKNLVRLSNIREKHYRDMQEQCDGIGKQMREEELTTKRNKLNRQISTLKKAALKEK